MKYKIMTDSTCDLTQEYIEKNDIKVLPLHITKGEESFLDMIEIHPEDIYQHERETGNLCSTSAINLYEYSVALEEFVDEYDAVIVITLGSKFSSCYQNAYIAAQDYENVYVVDSHNLSTGQGMLVMEAVELSKTEEHPEVLCEKLEEISKRIHSSFIVDRLDYLAKGGRCNALEALGAELLEIKPSIHVVNGEMIVGKKYTGFSKDAMVKFAHEQTLNLFQEAVIKYAKDQVEGCNGKIKKAIVAVASHDLDDLSQNVKEIITDSQSDIPISQTLCGCTVACHCGPTTLGITLLEEE